MADKTVYVDGTDNGATGHFLSLKAALDYQNANYQDLTSDNGSGGPGVLNIEISITTEDTAAATVHASFVTSATYYLNIYTTAAARHAGVWSNSKYRLVVANIEAVVIAENYVRIDGLQIAKSSSSANQQACVFISSQASGANDVRISNCILKQAGNNSYDEPGIYCIGDYTNLTVWNCLIYGLGTAASGTNAAFYAAYGNSVAVYSCTFVGGWAGCRGSTITSGMTAKNVYAYGSANGFYGTITKTNCASNDTTADGTLPLTSVAKNADTFVNVTAASEDFHLAADGLSPLQGAGTDTSGESAPLNFTTDIDGQTITTWSIGVDTIAGSPPASTFIPGIMRHHTIPVLGGL